VKLNTDEYFLAQSEEGVTCFHLAAGNNNVETLKKLWVWAEETQLNSIDLKKKLLIAKDQYGYTAWHRAVLRGSLELLQTLWIWAKEAELNRDELLLAQNEAGVTTFQWQQ
jgi:ankyrin repeat protein